MNSTQDITPDPPPRRCSRHNCNRLIPATDKDGALYTKKQCPGCLEQSARSKANAKRKRAQDDNELPPARQAPCLPHDSTEDDDYRDDSVCFD